MAKVSLRVYIREVEGMVEGGHLDEAIAHCQHILKTFPMHVETYQLLGKAFLEGRRYSDAADIFQRILMSVPDDFVSQVGMSIIRDDEGKLDDAIWHMERAFEVQPSNSAIQGELRRLYGRRDGVEPTKIRLSRDALANMYSQGELFNQAIAEIRAVLAEDPNRPDLQVMLSRAYYYAGQKVEAAEMAATLLKKYPYCLDALRVLVEVLPDSAKVENTQVYRQRLRMLDPYSAFVTDSVFASNKVADAAVNLEKLDYDPNAVPAASQPDWASSLGIKLHDEKRAEPTPDWLKKAETSKPAPASTPEPPGPASAPAGPGNTIPEWMRTAGWAESAGLAQESPTASIEERPAEPIAQADIPDWLKSRAPAGMDEAANKEPEAGESQPIGNAAFPDWLTNLDAVAPAPTEAAPAASAPGQPGEAESKPVDDGVVPDWLRDLGAGAPPATEAAPAIAAPEQPQEIKKQPEPVQPAPPEPVAKKPARSRLSAFNPEEKPFQPSGEVKPLGIGDDAMGWLESLAAKQGAKPEELLTNPQERSGEMPDWLHSDGNQPPASAPVAQEPAKEAMPVQEPATKTPPAAAIKEPAKNPPKTLPLEPISRLAGKPPLSPVSPLDGMPPLQSPPEGTAQPVNIEDDTLAWLEQLASNQGAKPEELLSKPEDRTGSMPEWIQNAAEEQPDAPAPAAGETIPPAPAPVVEDNTIVSWLSSLDKEEPVAETPPVLPVAPASQTQEGVPDWLKGLDKPEATQPAKTDEALPDWLRQTGQAPVSAPTPEPDKPAWFDEAAPVAEQAAPTAPAEWVPVEQAAPGPPASTPVSFSVATPAKSPALKGTGILARVPEQDKDAELLKGAQAALDGKPLDTAMKEYGKLIKKGRLLDEVIHDLREAIYRYPVDVIVWQTLGDAYMRANRLQDALDAYTKAEELLR